MTRLFTLISPDAVLAVIGILTIALPALTVSFRSVRRIIGLVAGLICAIIIRVCNPNTFGIATGMVMIAIAVLAYCLVATAFIPWIYRTFVPSGIRNGVARVLMVVGYILAIIAVIIGIGLLVAGLATI